MRIERGKRRVKRNTLDDGGAAGPVPALAELSADVEILEFVEGVLVGSADVAHQLGRVRDAVRCRTCRKHRSQTKTIIKF